MNRIIFFGWLCGVLTTGVVNGQDRPGKYAWKQTSSAGYTYRYVTNDPMQTRFYTLENGLTVILTRNRKEPRIAVRFAVRAGSNTDPDNHTGLAHYLEHLLFKGTDRYGSLDWSREKPYLDSIDGLYEKYNSTRDEVKRREIYKEIDRVSGQASKYAIANEYDKLMTDIGSQGTNAHTWVEETIYEEDIPEGAIDKFLAVESERFRSPVFRLFHTELEAVYEEKNRGLDDDGTKMSEAMHRYLFPTHNYGQHTTIGTIAHLKNPSLKAIRNYYNAYYVPNNMALIMSGDIDADTLIGKIDRAFSYMKSRQVNPYNPAPEKPILAPITKTIYGPSAENMRICFRTPAASTHDALVLDLIAAILSNGKAGLMDLDLNQQQKLQASQAFLQQYKDYGIFGLVGTPKPGQTLEQVSGLLMQEIAKLKKGDFDDALIRAIIANAKLAMLDGLQSNSARLDDLQDEFIKSHCERWDKNVSSLDDQAALTKKEIMAVATKYLGNDYLLLYKRKGIDKNIVKVEKPPITPIETNTGKQSDFLKTVEAMPVSDVKPQWLDFNTGITRASLGIADVLYVQNTENELFRLYYRLNIGSWNNRFLPLAAQYLQFLSTDKYSAAGISKAFYNLACNFSITTGTDNTTVSINGLQENFGKAAALFEEVLKNCKPDEAALAALKERLLKSRANAKLNKTSILQGLLSYARYGEKNPFNTTLSNDDIRDLKATDLVAILHGLLTYKHTVIYYGPLPVTTLVSSLSGVHVLPAAFTPDPPAASFRFTTENANKFLFADYDMVQSEICWIRNTTPYDVTREPLIDVFNNYFGGGMSSIVFQTIRESKALAYATFAGYRTPERKTDLYYMLAYIGCQADKMSDALKAMNALLDTLPLSDKGLDRAKTSLKKDMETERITQDGIIFSWLEAQKKGLGYDQRKEEYEALDTITLADIKDFHDTQLADKAYTYCVVASEKKISLEELRKAGEVKKLSLEEIFGY
ncbi:MAG: insulinase family protein [Puia sp.]|nr:insulinase family protein [Puia sp.]